MVYTIIEDRSGNIWIGTAGGGVTLFPETAFRIFSMQQGLGANSVYGITEDDAGNLWFGTNGGGVSKYDGKAFTIYSYDQGLAHPLVISSVKDSKSRLWFGTGGGGLVKFDGNIVPDGQAGFTAFTTVQGLAGNTVYSLVEDSKGNIWIGTAGGGVSKFDGKSFTNYTTEHGLSNNIVWSILEDKTGKLWFATQGGGISLFDGTTFSSFTTREGLADDTVYDLLSDNEGNIFIGTNRGFTVVPEHAVPLPVMEMQPFLEYYNTASGYPLRDVNKGIFLDSKGRIWAGSGSYKTPLVSFEYQALKKKRLKPAVKIKNISVNDKAISWNSLPDANFRKGEPGSENAYIVDEITTLGKVLSGSERQSLQKEMKSVRFSGISRFENFPEKLVLPYGHNNITIDFGTDELVRAHLIEYTYILKGYSKNWSPIIKKTSASFGNMWEGDYTFKVMARYTGPSEEEAKAWSEAAVYNFTVLPPWYRAWWAYLIYGLLLVALIRWIHRYQKARTIRKERERAQQKELEQAKETEKAYAELKSTQAQLIHAEKMASLGELTVGIAHEIQNPLNFVNNFSEISSELIEELNEELAVGNMKLVAEIAGDVKQNMGKITHHGKRAADIVKEMLQHSRTSNGNKEPTDINSLADKYVRLAYNGMRAKDKSFDADFKTEFDPTLPKINVIPQDIGRVLLNLINNAFYACTERSRSAVDQRMKNLTTTSNLTVTSNLTGFENLSGLDDTYQPTVTVTTKNLGNLVEIYVKDNGNGIPDAVKDKIFQPFFTTKPTGQGTGLGLSLSYDIVKAHGGDLKVESKKGIGAEFKVVLPV